MSQFKVGEDVKYNGQQTFIEELYDDGTAKIENPEWDYDDEGDSFRHDIEYDVPYWITVPITELRKVK